MIFHAFLIKYAEIAIKGKNRYIFEDALVKQMNIALSKVEGEFEVKKEQGRIYVFCPEQYDYDETVEALQHVFGIVGICPVVIYEDQGFEQMAKDVVSYMKNCHPNYDGSFKVYTRRAKKSYPITSMEVSAELGGRILDEFPDASVDVHEPDLTLSVEIRDKIYVYSQTIKGAGGMPIGTNGKAMLLLSGGIDSPVAGYMIAKRGVKIDGTVYGIQKDSDILRIKRGIVNDKFAETDDNFDMDTEIAKIQHTDITLEQPTSEQLSQIQSKTFDSMSDMKQYVQSVMNGELTQDEINAMLMLQIAELKAGVDGE